MKNTNTKNPIDIYLRIVLLTLLLLWSFFIVRPFVTLIVWSIILAVALYPMYQKLLQWTKGKKKGLVTSLFVLVLLALIVVPTIRVTGSVMESGASFFESFKAGTLKVPPPRESVSEWPLVGNKLYGLWSQASRDLESFMVTYKDQISSSLGWFASAFKGLMGSVFLGLFALIFAGVFLSSADGGYKAALRFADRIHPGKGQAFVEMCTNTIRSVVKGILLVAIIQAILAYIGFVVIGLPAAGVFALVVFILAVIQVPALLAMIPAIAIVFSTHDTTPAIIFAVYAIIVSLSDNVLKPMLLGKGLETPMLVILVGALGGMILQGILGLFIGPVVLSILYQLYQGWLAREPADEF